MLENSEHDNTGGGGEGGGTLLNALTFSKTSR